MERHPTLNRFLPALFAAFFAIAFTRLASAAPEAHILRIDPRAGVTNGAPELTTIIEIVQNNPLSTVLAGCANMNGNAALDCESAAVETPNKLWSAIPFPDANAHFFVKVNGEDTLTKFVSKQQWGAAKKDPNVGTAWLVVVDGSSGMGARYEDAREVAHEFIAQMEPNDLMDLMIFDDRVQPLVEDSGWKTKREQNDIVKTLTNHPTNSPSHGRDRPLFEEIKAMTVQAFGALGNTSGPQNIPMHQAMVVLSNGAGRGDAASASPSAEVFHQYLNAGRFPPENTSLPKTPLPVISIWFPNAIGLIAEERNNDEQFMRSLANNEIGGFFDIVRDHQAVTKAKAIISVVKHRFDEMWIVKWRLSCLNSSVEQSFNLVFVNTRPTIAPDGSFKEVPIGVDPSQWPLDVDVAATQAEAAKSPLYPGGTFKVLGDFCWSGDKTRAEAYFVPAGTKQDPNANSSDPEVAKKVMQNLIAQNMRGGAIEAGDTFVTLNVPDDEKMLDGQGDNTVARVVVYDNKAHRASGHDEKSILTLKAGKKPFNVLLIAGIAGGATVIVLLVIVMVRGGGGSSGGRKRGGTPPPAPVVAGGYPPPGGGGYGPPPGGGGYGPPPGGGGYGPPPQGGYGPPPGGAGGGGYGGGGQGFAPIASEPMAVPAGAAPSVIQVTCPSCSMMTMATIGQPSVCFSCGQPLPPNIASGAVPGGGGVAQAAPTFPLTGAVPSPLEPPPNPYGASAGAAVITGSAGQYMIRAGGEIRVGRDPAQCAVTLPEPRVSGVHASLKFEASQLWARDETSNNGTWIEGTRIAPGTWVSVPPGAQLRFGPIEFSVRLET